MSGSTFAPGTELPAFVVAAVAPDRMRTMAALLDDPTPIHLDRAAAAAAGFGERRVNQGPMAIGYALEALTRWAGSRDAVSRLRLRFLDNVFEGERLECRATVTALAAGTCEVEIAITSNGRPVAAGSAALSPPSRPSS